MARIDLSDDEAALLREVCEDALSELHSEIVHTDSLDFREGLKRKEAFLKSLLARLSAPAG
jgi:hypothetical protein